MMMTKFAAVIVIKVESQRQLARPLSTVQQQYLRALGVPATYFTVPQRGYRAAEFGQSRVNTAILILEINRYRPAVGDQAPGS